MSLRRSALALLVLVVSACGETPTAREAVAPSVAGSWVQATGADRIPASFDATQDEDGALTGCGVVTYLAAPPATTALSGSISVDSTMTVILTWSDHADREWAFSGKVVGNLVTGSAVVTRISLDGTRESLDPSPTSMSRISTTPAACT